ANQLEELSNKEAVVVGGLVKKARPILTKKQQEMGFVTIEDNTGEIELVIFPSVWETIGSQIEGGALLLVKGKVDHRENSVSVLADQVSRVETTGLKDSLADNRNQGPYYEQILAKYLPDINALRRFAFAASAERDSEPDTPRKTEEAAEPADPYEEPEWEESTYSSSPLPAEPEPEAAPDLPAPQASAAEIPTEPERETPQASSFHAAPPPPAPERAEALRSPRLLVTIRSCGEKERDLRQIRQIHGFLTSHPGENHFFFYILEAGATYEIEFPNETTDINERILAELNRFLGGTNVQLAVD
ncbi:MAG: OB-fold nucleic acid binding domain-containing protein, partial [Anaerolineaceae bacterium]